MITKSTLIKQLVFLSGLLFLISIYIINASVEVVDENTDNTKIEITIKPLTESILKSEEFYLEKLNEGDPKGVH